MEICLPKHTDRWKVDYSTNKDGRGWTLWYLFFRTWSVYITNFQLKYNFKISLKNKNMKLARKKYENKE